MNEPVMVIQATLFTSNYNYLVAHVLTLYKLLFIHVENDLHLWSLSDCEQPSLWPLLCKIIPLYFPRISHSSRGKFSKIVSNAFHKCSRALNLRFFFKTAYS